MNPITAAVRALEVRRLTRKYVALNKLNASEQDRAAKALVTERIKNF